MKHTVIVILLVVRASLASLLGQPFVRPSIDEVAQRYGERAPEMVRNYHRLLGEDSSAASHALDKLWAEGAYPVLALALPETKDGMRNEIAFLLQQAEGRDAVIISSVVWELSKENAVVIYHGGEMVGANYLMQRWLIRTLAKQTGLDATQVDVWDQQQVSAFVAKVRVSK